MGPIFPPDLPTRLPQHQTVAWALGREMRGELLPTLESLSGWLGKAAAGG